MSTKKAITYYKLESNYEGDITKYCSLAGTEIDANFYFLRGNDIADGVFDSTTKVLKLTKVNGEVLEIPFKCCCCDIAGTTLTGSTSEIVNGVGVCDCCVDDIYYDKKTATLHYISKGVDKVIEGFYSAKDFRTDYTLKGDGSDAEPLRISGVMTTGSLAPALGFVDFTGTISGDTVSGDTVSGITSSLPDKPEHKDRYVSYEWITPYGMLFNFAAVEAINDILSKNNDGWRVPTKEDWDAMLNAVEHCDEDRNHRSKKSSPYLGKWAGAYLKSLKADWAKESIDALDGHEISWDRYGFDILPAGDYYEGRNHSYGKIGAYWTSTMCEDGDVWVKKFHGNKNTVQQRAAETDLYMSIRLVKDIEKGFNETEVIEGVPYNCVLMPSLDEKGNKSTKVWTVQNISMKGIMEGDSRYPKAKAKPVLCDVECTDGTKGNEAPGEFKYFINEYYKDAWVKREMTEGMFINLEVGIDGSKDEEWIIIDGEFVKKSELIYSRVKEYVNEIVAEEASARTIADAELSGRIDFEVSARTEADKILAEAIVTEAEEREVADDELWEGIAAATAYTAAEAERLDERIDEEASARTEADAALSDRIDTLADDMKAANDELWEGIAAATAYTAEEVERSKKIDENLADLLGAEGDAVSGFTMNFNDFDYSLLDSDSDEILIIDTLLKEGSDKVVEVHSKDELDAIKDTFEYEFIVFDNPDGHPEHDEYYARITPYKYVTEQKNVLDALKKLDEGIQDEETERKEADTALLETIKAENERAEKEEGRLDKKIDEEISARTEDVADLWDGVANATAYTESEAARLDKKIDDEVEARKNADLKLDEYTLEHASIAMEIPTNDGKGKITVKLPEDFFNFGTF